MLNKVLFRLFPVPNISLFQQKNSVKVNYSTPRWKRKALRKFVHSHQLKTATERSSFEVELWCSNILSKLAAVGGVGRIVCLERRLKNVEFLIINY